MFIARIDGSITSTVKHRSLRGFRLLVSQRLDTNGKEVGEPLVVLDTLGAGIGTQVIVSSDGELARTLVSDNATPSRMVVVGIVDEVGIGNRESGSSLKSQGLGS